MDYLIPIVHLLEEGKRPNSTSDVKVYKKSFTKVKQVKLLMVKKDATKYLLVTGEGDLFSELKGKSMSNHTKICSLTHENRKILNRYLEYTVPRAFGTHIGTIGLGDRLGIATPGHIEALEGSSIKPILAQQSIRELTLSKRTMTDMLDDVCYAVIQQGYTGGFGADADHIKEEPDLKAALSIGMSMITLDCSDYIDKELEESSTAEIEEKYNQLPKEQQSYYSAKYLNKTFNMNGLFLEFDDITLMKNVLLYEKAISYTTYLYAEYIAKEDRTIDFELSIDETATVTSPLAHLFVANELKDKEVNIVSLAPRFYGEFQKAIDYIGDAEVFEEEFKKHEKIAEYFNYKLSIHSGSDKFSVYPIIAKHTKGIFHIKTAGTNWLEAIRVIAYENPNLYREIHQYVLNHYDDAMKYYHITPNIYEIEPINDMSDQKLRTYLDDDNMRQLLHITYGLLLTVKDDNNDYRFRDKIFNTLEAHENVYNDMLIKHIGKHLEKLNLK